MAPVAHVLFNKFMTFNPKNPDWVNRDRFVLSYVHPNAFAEDTEHTRVVADEAMRQGIAGERCTDLAVATATAACFNMPCSTSLATPLAWTT